MSRAPIFRAVSTARGRGFTEEEVPILDVVLDRLGVPRDKAGSSLTPSRAAFETIKHFESCELTAYPDPGTGGDPWTVGWGSTGPGIRKGVVWTQQQADDRLRDDVNSFAVGVQKLVDGSQTTQSEFDALVSFAYNVGLGALEKSTLLKKHRAGDKDGAAAEFARWDKAGGRVLKGLTRRRAAEAGLYRNKS